MSEVRIKKSGDVPVADLGQMDAILLEAGLLFRRRQFFEKFKQIHKQNVIRGGDVAHGLNVGIMQRHKLMQVLDPPLGEVSWLLPDLMRGRRGEQDGRDAMFTGEADHGAEIGTEVSEGDTLLGMRLVGHHFGEEQLVDQLHNTQAGDGFVQKQGMPGVEGGEVLVLGAERAPVVIPTIIDGDDTRLHGQYIAFELLQALIGGPPAGAHVDEGEMGGRILRAQNFVKGEIVFAELRAGATHENQLGTLAGVGRDTRAIIVRHPEEILVRLIEPQHGYRVGVAELDFFRVKLKFKMQQTQHTFDHQEGHEQAGHAGQGFKCEFYHYYSQCNINVIILEPIQFLRNNFTRSPAHTEEKSMTPTNSQTVHKKWPQTVVCLLLLALACFGLRYLILKDSFVASNGLRYFTVNDDSLISMRYAWNLAHGKGLVWNQGEHVEGFTNPLWTLYAAFWALFTPRRMLPHVLQLSGIACLFVQCWLLRRLALRLWRDRQPAVSPGWITLACLLPIAYYPLVYWSINGLEVCAVGMVATLALLWFVEGRSYLAALALGAAFWLRPDVLLLGCWVFGLAFLDACIKRFAWRKWIASVIILAAGVAVLFLLRKWYYGTHWPNTYILKLRHFDLSDRLRLNTWGYLRPFLMENTALILVALASLLIKPSRLKLLLAGPALFMTAYAGYVGGDALPHWRFMAPFVPLLALVALAELPAGGAKLRPLWLLGGLLAAGAWFWASIPCYRERVSGPDHHEWANIETAFILDQVLKPDATIGVLHAGGIPYYTDFRAIDFLGKCDPRIAHLKPRFDDHVHWGGMFSVPGHNKHDLSYSIMQLQPTFIEAFAWGTDNAGLFARENYVYVAVPFETDSTDTYILLRRDSPQVDWAAVRRLDPNVKL